MKKELFTLFAGMLIIFGISAQQVEREMVVLEIGTGTWCYYCPGAAMGADDLIENGHDVAVVEYHNGDPFANTYSNSRISYYGISGFPTAFFDGVLEKVGGSNNQSMYPQYLPLYNQRKAINSSFTLDVSGIGYGDTYEVNVVAEKVASYNNDNLIVHVALTESHIPYNWQGMSEVNFVERLMAPDQYGTEVDFSQGDIQQVDVTFDVDPDWVKENMELTVFIQDNSTKEILQGTKLPLNDLPSDISADFEANTTYIEEGDEIEFTDLSAGPVENWQWTFEGGTPSSSNEENPTVVYEEPGLYDVTLYVWNDNFSDTITKEDYIFVLPVYEEEHWEFEGGNPADPVYTMYISGAEIQRTELEYGDEIAIYDGETMVGHMLLDTTLSPELQFEHDLIAFSTVVSGNGYTPGNPIIIKCWDASEEMEYGPADITFSNPYGDAWTDPYYPEGDGEYSLVEFTFGGTSSQQMTLGTGYQFVSSHIQPGDPDLMVLLNDMMDDETLDFVRNSDGSMLQKIGPNWVNNIGNWVTIEGYLFKMFEEDMLSMEGSVMDPTTPIPVSTGYQFVSYLPASAMDAMDAFNSIIGDDLDLIRASDGSQIMKIGPNWVNNIGNAMPGQGYLVKMFNPGEIIYPTAAKSAGTRVSEKAQYFNFEGGNPADPVYTIFLNGQLQAGDEVAAYCNGKMVGATTITSDNTLANDLSIFKTLTNGKGYQSGSEITLKLYDSSDNNVYNLAYTLENPHGDAHIANTYPQGDGAYSIAKLEKSGKLNTDIAQVEVYPNPAGDMVNISGNAGDLIRIYSLVGELVKEVKANTNLTTINLEKVNAGIYFIRIDNRNEQVTKKFIVK